MPLSRATTGCWPRGPRGESVGAGSGPVVPAGLVDGAGVRSESFILLREGASWGGTGFAAAVAGGPGHTETPALVFMIDPAETRR